MHNSPRRDQRPAQSPRLPWVQPVLRPAGSLGDVLKGGSNKVTVVTGDPGEPQKVPGNDL